MDIEYYYKIRDLYNYKLVCIINTYFIGGIIIIGSCIYNIITKKYINIDISIYYGPLYSDKYNRYYKKYFLLDEFDTHLFFTSSKYYTFLEFSKYICFSKTRNIVNKRFRKHNFIKYINNRIHNNFLPKNFYNILRNFSQRCLKSINKPSKKIIFKSKLYKIKNLFY